MKSKKILFVVVLLLTSCMFIEVNLTIKDNYQSAIRNKELNVVFESPNFCSLDYNDTIYALKGNELKQCLSSIPKALVYIWPPYCKMDNCLAVHVVQEYCDTNGYDLFVVCTDYTVDAIKAQLPPKRPFFSINHIHHGSKLFGENHTYKFELELTGKEETEGRFLEFIEGEYIKSFYINSNK